MKELRRVKLTLSQQFARQLAASEARQRPEGAAKQAGLGSGASAIWRTTTAATGLENRVGEPCAYYKECMFVYLFTYF